MQWHPLPLLPLSPLWWHYLSKAWQLRWRKMYFDHWVPRPWWRSPQPDHRCPGGQQRYCTNPGHCWFKRMSHGSSASCAELSNIQKANNFEKVSRFIHEVRSEIQWYFFLSIFFRMSSGERRLNHGWSANSLRSCQLRRRFCPGHDVIAQMLSWRRDISPAHSSTLRCWVPVQKICLQLLDPH